MCTGYRPGAGLVGEERQRPFCYLSSFYLRRETQSQQSYPVSKIAGETQLELSMSFYHKSFYGSVKYCTDTAGQYVGKRLGRLSFQSELAC